MGKTIHKERLPKKVINAGALEFEPWTIDLERLPDNEKFGEQMRYVRLAAVFLTQPKAKLVEMIREFAQSDEAIQDHINCMKSLERCEGILREFADMIGAARARMFIANSAAEIATAAG
jgi:hypothetical protein